MAWYGGATPTHLRLVELVVDDLLGRCELRLQRAPVHLRCGQLLCKRCSLCLSCCSCCRHRRIAWRCSLGRNRSIGGGSLGGGGGGGGGGLGSGGLGLRRFAAPLKGRLDVLEPLQQPADARARAPG